MSVFGADNRTRVTNTSSFPWSAVVRVQVTFPDGSNLFGTGAMVSSEHVLTAGHVVYSKSHGGWATSVMVTPGQNGTSKPFGNVSYSRLRSWAGWTKYSYRAYDLALITLSSSIGNSTGWFGLRANGIKAGTSLNTAGYPGDKGTGTTAGKLMYRAFGPVSFVSGDVANYNGSMDTHGGQSGSPLWVYNSTSGARHVVGVHSGYNSANTYNQGAVLTTAKFNTIVGWINTDGGFSSSVAGSMQAAGPAVSRQFEVSGAAVAASAASSSNESFDVAAWLPTTGPAAKVVAKVDEVDHLIAEHVASVWSSVSGLGLAFAGNHAIGGKLSDVFSDLKDHLSWLNW